MSRGAPGPWRGSLWAWLLPTLGLIATCGTTGLIEPTETRYAAIARAMLDSGDWLVPRLNGIPHFHKPPVAYWLSAGGMALLGVNEWGARLAVALAAGFMLWCAARIAASAAKSLGSDDGGSVAGASPSTLAPTLLASCALFFVIARQLASDVFLAGSVAGFYAAWVPERSRRGWWPFVALGVGFMAKGPILLVLTVLPVLVAAAWTRRGALARPLANGRGWLLFAAIALPWYLLSVARTPGLLAYFLGNQVWERYTTTEHQRGGPLWYFIPVLLGGALPWTWAALRGAARTWRRVDETGALLLAWIVVPFVFLSFSGSKLPAYVLPVFPAVAVLTARGLSAGHRASRIATSLTLAVLGIAAAVAVFSIRPGGAALPPEILAAGCAASVALLAAASLAARSRWTWAAGAAFAAFLVVAASARPVDGALGSPRALVEVLRTERRAGEPVLEFAHFNAGLPFYLGENAVLLEVGRERLFLDERALERIRIERGALPALTARAGRAWVLGPDRGTEAMLREMGLPAERRARWRDEGLFLVTPAGG